MTIGMPFTLNNQVVMPSLGLGCYKAHGDEIYQAVRWAIEAGYRMVDTASRYENEEAVGRGVRESGVPREDLFVVSKLWPTRFDKPAAGIDFSLRELNTDYMDLYLLHWPGTDDAARFRAWEALLGAVEQQKIRAIGVSNFQIPHLESLIKEFGVVPAVNQIELHPWYPQRELVQYCREHDIAVTAWGPIFRGHIAEVPLMDELASKYGKSPVQVTLRWHVQHGNIIIPKSSNKARIISNSELFDFELSDEDMRAIDALECGKHFGDDPYTFDGAGF